MTLILSVLRCPDAVPPQTRQVTGGEFSIGRGPDNDWTLPDPDGFLSRRHCVLAYRSGGWQLADVSTNGTFHNRDPDPLGKGAPRDLQDGDRIRMGNYEIEIRIEADAASGWRDPPPRAAAQSQPGAFADPFGDDPFNPPPAPPAVSPGFGTDPMLGFGRQANGSVTLPDDFDPLGADFEAPFTGPTQSDHASALEDRFRPPVPLPPQPGLPADLDDWDLDLTPQPAPAPPPAAPQPTAPPPAAPPPPVPPPPPEAPPAADPFADLDLTPPPAPPPVIAPVAPVAAPAAEPEAFPALPAGDVADPFAEIDVPAVPFAAPPAATPAAPAPAAARAAPPEQAPAIAGDDLLAAFLRGAGMEESRPADPLATMHALGAAFRALVGGLRQALIARATVKGEFRIEQTMIRARGNNPLKFSAGDDDAMAALIGAGRRIDMPPAAAIAEVLRDMRLHELATMAAMQAAVRALLERLDPAPLRAEGERGGGLLPAQRRARAFESFEKLHGEISRALADDFDSVFGKAFARAYEQALHEIADKDTP